MLFKLRRFIKNIGNNIAFIPAVLGLSGFFLAILLYYLESIGISKFLIEKIPALVVNNYNTASTLLSTFSAGILSLMVFSFSMVMLLLNQAGANFSPRVLPGLISVKSHQYIIGLFLGTILYNAIVLIGLKPSNNQYQLPGFSVLIGMLLTVICLFAFIYFIDSISKSIQVQNILSRIFFSAENRMNFLIKQNSGNRLNSTQIEFNQNYPATKTGYLQEFNENVLLSIATENDLIIKLNILEGNFVLKDENLFTANKTLDASTIEAVNSGIVIDRSGENIVNNYLLGFKQVTEIGLRAMSPGINDPATAITTIDYLTELFSIQMFIAEGERFVFDADEQIRLIIPAVSFGELLYQVMVEYRNYCKADMSCMQKLVMMLNKLENLPQAKETHRIAIQNEKESLMKDAEMSITNPYDFKRMHNLIKPY